MIYAITVFISTVISHSLFFFFESLFFLLFSFLFASDMSRLFFFPILL